MRWILFWVFVLLFVIVVLGTLGAMFFGFGHLTDSERSTLFKFFIVEIAAAIVALFYSIFGLKNKSKAGETRVRLNLGRYADVRKLTGSIATLAPSQVDGTSLTEADCRILYDNGPYLPLSLPPSTYSVYVTVQTGENTYSGSFVVGTYLVDLTKDEE